MIFTGMEWITLQYFPGLGEDLTKWTITVGTDGSFAQKVELNRPIRRSHRLDNRVLKYEGKISALQLNSLREMWRSVDLDQLISFADFPVICDLPDQRTTVEDGSQTRSFSGPIFWYLSDQRRGDLPQGLPLKELVVCWKFIHDLAPFPPDEDRVEQRQILPNHLPKMTLEITKAETPHFMRDRPPTEKVEVSFDDIRARLDAVMKEAWAYLDQRAAHNCPRNPEFQILEYFWPPDDGTPLAESEHLRAITVGGLCADDAVARLIHDGCMSSVEVVPIRVSDEATCFRLLCHQERSSNVFARGSKEECHPFSLFVGPAVPRDDPDVCLGKARYQLHEENFSQYFRGRISNLK